MPAENEDLVEPHVESMNYFLSEGMQAVVADMKPMEVKRCSSSCQWLPMSASTGLLVHAGS